MHSMGLACNSWRIHQDRMIFLLHDRNHSRQVNQMINLTAVNE
jgi:hypothetical protein